MYGFTEPPVVSVYRTNWCAGGVVSVTTEAITYQLCPLYQDGYAGYNAIFSIWGKRLSDA